MNYFYYDMEVWRMLFLNRALQITIIKSYELLPNHFMKVHSSVLNFHCKRWKNDIFSGKNVCFVFVFVDYTKQIIPQYSRKNAVPLNYGNFPGRHATMYISISSFKYVCKKVNQSQTNVFTTKESQQNR